MSDKEFAASRPNLSDWLHEVLQKEKKWKQEEPETSRRKKEHRTGKKVWEYKVYYSFIVSSINHI